MKGKTLGFFEYHNDRSNLFEESAQHHRGAVPFNRPQQYCPPGRPVYRGTGIVPFEDEFAECYEQLPDMSAAFLDIDRDSVSIQNVLRWMKNNRPLTGPGQCANKLEVFETGVMLQSVMVSGCSMIDLLFVFSLLFGFLNSIFYFFLFVFFCFFLFFFIIQWEKITTASCNVNYINNVLRYKN